MDWVGLNESRLDNAWAGLGWLDWTSPGLDWTGLDWTGLGWAGLCEAELDWDWTGLG